jgi:hypothetical protein
MVTGRSRARTARDERTKRCPLRTVGLIAQQFMSRRRRCYIRRLYQSSGGSIVKRSPYGHVPHIQRPTACFDSVTADRRDYTAC